MLVFISLLAAVIALVVIANFRLHFFKLDILEEINKNIKIPERAKDSKGRFVADDPATPENEAWVVDNKPVKRGRPAKNKK